MLAHTTIIITPTPISKFFRDPS
jgi:hypothetical protein